MEQFLVKPEVVDEIIKDNIKIIEECKAAIVLNPYNFEEYTKWSEAIKNLPDPDKYLDEFSHSIECVNMAYTYNEYGNLLYDFKKFPEAIEQYQKAIESDVNHKYAYCNWGLTLEQLQKYDEAIEKYKKAIEIDPEYADAFNSYGFLLYNLKKYPEAIEQYQKAIESDVNHKYAYHNWGRALEQLQKYDEAIEKYKKAIEIDSEYTDAFNSYGALLYNLKKYPEAIEQYQKAINSDVNHKYAYRNWGLALEQLQKYDEAIEKYKKAINIDPNYADAYNDSGVLLYLQKKYAEAIEQYQKAINSDANHKYAYCNWGRALEGLNDFDLAIEKYKKAIDIDPKNLLAYSNWRDTIRKMTSPDEYFDEYSHLIEINLSTADAYNDFGILLLDLKKYPEAIIQFRKAIDSDAQYSYAYNNWGVALEHLQKYEEAIKKFTKAIDLNPDLFNAYNNLGWLYNKNNNNSEALEIFEKALKNNAFINEKYDLHFGKGYVLDTSGRFKDAIDEYEISFSYKNFPYPLHNIASLFEKRGLYKKAKEKWNQALEIYEKNREVEFNKKNASYFLYYGSIYHFSTLKDLVKAESIYLQGLELEKDNTQILFNLIQLCQEKRDEILTTNDSNDTDFAKTVEHCKVMDRFRQAERILNKRLEQTKSADILAESGSFYKEMGFFDKALKKYTEALKLNKTHIQSLTNLGAIEINYENYQKAIEYFKQASEIDPDNFDIKSNLAEAYLKAGKTEDAERLYSEIIDIAPYHMDSLIGISQTYITMGENAKKEKDYANADIMFSKAEDNYSNIVHLMNNPDHASKILNQNEKSSVYYLMGYNDVMVYEIQKNLNNSLNPSHDCNCLVSAKDNFKLVKKGTKNYYKAQRAITKIDNILNPPRGTVAKVGPALILIFSAIVFLLTQVYYFLGLPEYGFSGYSIDTRRLEKLIIPASDKLNQSIVEKLDKMADQNYVFVSADDFYNRMKYEFNDNIISTLKQSNLLKNSNDLTIQSFHRMETGYYVLTTFGCLLFMIAGLYLNQISKLKVGTLELEKSTIDQISTPMLLGITK